MSLESIVQVNIRLETTAVERQGFGIPMLIGEHDLFVDRVRTYPNIAAVAEDFGTETTLYRMALAVFSQEVKLPLLKIGRKDEYETYEEALIEIENADSDFYAVTIDSIESSDITEMATAIEAREKIFIARTADATILDPNESGDLASSLQASAFFRTALFYHSQAATVFPDAAWLGEMLPDQIGSSTWVYKTLAGVPFDTFTGTQVQALESKNCNFYNRVAGLNITRTGKMAGGEFIDVVIGRDWLVANLRADMADLLFNARKIPYTDKGITRVENVLRRRLDIGVDIGLIDQDYTVSVPTVATTEFTDRANRILRNVNFSARLQGAIHQIVINGTLTV